MAETESDLKRAYDALTAKYARYTLLFAYYDNIQPIRYVSDRLREVFQTELARFTQNWASVVVDSQLDRVHLNEFTVADNPTATDALNSAFSETELDLDANDVHKAALICGESFVCVWRDSEDEVEAYYNDPRNCHVFYDEENPRYASFAAKWWVGGKDGLRYINLYYPERIEYYVSTADSKNITASTAFKEASPPEKNPEGVIPIFHFRPDRRVIKSALTDVVDIQDAINKLFQDMMVAAEFGAFPQRYVISNSDGISTLKNSPSEIWNIPAGDGMGQSASVGQFAATGLSNYLDSMERLSKALASINEVPKQYMQGQGGDPSGEALIAMEAPLNKKAERFIDCMKPTWQAVGAFILQLQSMPVDKKTIDPGFDRPETVQPLTQTQIIQAEVTVGIPLNTALKREGWTAKEIDAMEADKAESGANAAAGQQAGDATAVNATFARLGIADLLPSASVEMTTQTVASNGNAPPGG